MKEDIEYGKMKSLARQLVAIMQERGLEDYKELRRWMEENSAAPGLLEILSDPGRLQSAVGTFRSADPEKGLEELREKVGKYRRRRRLYRVVAAAAVVVVFIFSALLLEDRGAVAPELVSVTPGSLTTPCIVRGDGLNIDLSDASSSLLEGKDIPLAVKDKGELQLEQEKDGDVGGEGMANTLFVPMQCDYRVILSDGTKVSINAGSSLTFCDRFSATERRVKLEGEAYFEVAREARPFIVEVEQVAVQVFGTEFNINSYNKNAIETVLVDGRVGISVPDGGGQMGFLEPNQLCRVASSGEMQIVKDVCVGKYIAWTEGRLCYEDDRLEELTDDLARWYGAGFVYEDEGLKGIKVTSSIDRELPFGEVLPMIEEAVGVKFNLKGRRYHISRR